MTLNKIITTAALVAASTALSSAAVVLSQTFTPSGGTATSLWTTLEGQPSKTSSITGLTCDRYSDSRTTITGADSGGTSSISTSVSNLYGYSGSEISGKAFQINSFSLLGPGNSGKSSGALGNDTQGTITIVGTYNGASVSYVSSTPDDSACYDGSSLKSTYQARVYSFENAFFDAGSTLTISGTGSFGYAVVKTTNSATISPETVSDASSNWNSVFSISAQAIPEPSAFGLLAGIGALAFAVSRRRRSR